MKIAILGSSSYVAQHFIKVSKDKYHFLGFSRKNINLIPNIQTDDFFFISQEMLTGCDVVINFAAIVHQGRNNDAGEYEIINSQLPVHLAKIAKQAGVSHFIQMSTISVYGEKSYIDDKTIPNPTTLYGISKLKADEKLIQMNDKAMAITVLRPSMIYGGRQAPGNLQSLIRLAKFGFPLPFKNINNHRNFMNIDNFCQLLDHIINKRVNKTLILADERGVSTEHLVSSILDALGKPNRIFSFPIFWKIVQYIFPKLYLKLAGDLKIKPSISLSSLGLSEKSIEKGIAEMI